MAYFDCQIVQSGGGIILTVECYQVFAGAAITATDGETTLSQTCPSSSPYEVQFNIPNAGTWTISGAYNGETYSTQVVIPSGAILFPIPNGSTATPTAVIQTWLHCANIWDKNYTTIAQVLADSTTFLALISSNNAVDYMARSTTWASSVCANSSAMTMIGANNYCADALLADITWCAAICNSTYFESVLNTKVPTQTSDNSNILNNGYATTSFPYYAFDRNASTRWIKNGVGAYIGYHFSNAVKIKKVIIKNGIYNNTVVYKIQYSTTGNTNDWHDVSEQISFNSDEEKTIILTTGNGAYWRIIGLSSTNTDYGILEMQFYGRVSS